jgi:hypothetical protein
MALDLSETEKQKLLAAVLAGKAPDDIYGNQESDLSWPRSDVPTPKKEAFLTFHAKKIDELVSALSSKNSRESNILVLHGALGAGKRRVALEVAFGLKQRADKSRDSVAIYHEIDHVTTSEDVKEAVDKLIERIAISLNLPITESPDTQKEEIKRRIGKYNYRLVICGLRPDIANEFFRFFTELPKLVRILITYPSGIDTALSFGNKKLEYKNHALKQIDPENTDDIKNFLSACGVDSLTDDQARRIGERTKGDSFTLRQVATCLIQNGNQAIDAVLENNLSPSTNRFRLSHLMNCFCSKRILSSRRMLTRQYFLVLHGLDLSRKNKHPNSTQLQPGCSNKE